MQKILLLYDNKTPEVVLASDTKIVFTVSQFKHFLFLMFGLKSYLVIFGPLTKLWTYSDLKQLQVVCVCVCVYCYKLHYHCVCVLLYIALTLCVCVCVCVLLYIALTLCVCIVIHCIITVCVYCLCLCYGLSLGLLGLSWCF